VNGDPTWSPLYGVLTVTPASAGIATVAIKDDTKAILVTRIMLAGEEGIFIEAASAGIEISRTCLGWRKALKRGTDLRERAKDAR
jgi:hypothetical protein